MTLKSAIFETIDKHAADWTTMSLDIGAHPELGHEEFRSSALLADELEKHGFTVERGTLGLPTAFIGTYDSGKPGPIAAFLCEYDALPEIGHACGHHIIGVMGVAAAVGLKSVIDETGGIIRVYGTPAEETKGAKVTMAEAGLFDDCSFALMAHPYHAYEKSGESLAMDAVQFEFFGKTAHAAANPHDGVNALDAVVQLFNSLNALRQQVRSDARLHGIIDAGGQAPNIIPDYASAKFYFRSADRAYTNELTQRALRCAEGAALQTGCTLKTNAYEYSYDELRTNETLSGLFSANLIAGGVPADAIQSGKDNGSLDLGNVSVRCPAIHPYVQVVDDPFQLHTIEFRDAAMQPRAMQGLLFGAKILAATAYDVCADPALLRQVREEFERTRK
ncbi:amidohydrolase [Paenibacillus cellulosilyticus]|uniref:Peptidase M20 domain-containing protein 2 n=1 Tax=Paenibacillus cellulosilyticus TaxID=375489 RepID=A0A2V2YQS8_9BACL|nr:M20 family metallopeptidase [Paenibacillus cellulosilyticus]PWV99427.1 amidohydrolase [Paenibacillus cellulosilyticus]QKS44688.1 M20 family metallopeptidase [Paenibacillus cellulosilyticus]